MAKVTKITEGAFIESDNEAFIDIITIFGEYDNIKTFEELTKWYNNAQALLKELTIDGFKQLVLSDIRIRREYFDDACIRLQGGL